MAERKTYLVGVTESAPTAFAGEAFGFAVDFDVTDHVDPGVMVTLEVWVSTDGGASWQFEGSCTREGGAQDERSVFHGNVAGFRVEHSITAKDRDGKLKSNVAKWVDPLFKTVTKVNGAPVNLKVDPVIAKPRTAPLVDAHQSIAVVQSVSVFGTLVASVTTAAITTTAGNLLVANLIYLKFSSAFSSFTDSKSNTWTESVAEVTASNTGIRQRYVESCSGGSSHTFTLTMTSASNSYPDIVLNEVSGYAASPLDQTKTATDASGTSHATGSTGTTAQANELLIACGSGGVTFNETYTSAGGSWTTVVNQANVSGSKVGGLVETQVVTSGPSTYSWTYTSSGSMPAAQYITTWKEAAAGASGGGPIFGVGMLTEGALYNGRLYA